MRKSLLLFCLATLAMILTAKAQIPFSISSLPWRDLTEDQFKSKFVTPEDSGNYIRVFQKMNYYDSLSDHVMTLKYIDSCLLYKPDDGNLYLLKAFQYYLMRKGVAADYACRIADSLGTIDIIYLFRPMNRLFLLFDTTGVYSDLRIAMNKFADNKELWIVIGVYEFLIESPDYLQYFLHLYQVV